jgi:hypothetical protein
MYLHRHFRMKNKFVFTALAAGLMLGLSGCAQQAPTARPEAGAAFIPAASIQEIMASIVDTNADDVWNSVATIITRAGIEERAPHTEEEWSAVRRHAVTLAEASNLLVIEGRQVAAPGASTSDVPAELGAAEIQKDIAANRQDFVARAQAFHGAVQQAIAAIDARNSEGLVRAGGIMDQACEACHLQFWYPLNRSAVATK